MVKVAKFSYPTNIYCHLQRLKFWRKKTEIHCESKRDLYTFAHNFGICWRIFEIFPLLNSSRNLQQTDCHIAHHTLDVLLHYLVKWQLSQTAICIILYLTQILAEENRNSSTTTDVIIKMSSPCNVSVYGDTVTIMNSSIISEVYSTFTFTGMSEASKFELSCSASVVACSVTAWHFPPKVHGVVLKFHWLEYITHLGHQHTL